MAENLEQSSTSGSTGKKKTMPVREQDILMVLETMIPKMDEEKIELRWLNTNDLKQKHADYRSLVENKTGVRSARRPKSQRIREMNTIIDKQIEYVKKMIDMQYRLDKSVAYYANFGIEKNRKGYKLPLTMESRAESLKVLVKELENHNWTNDTDGSGYWSVIRDEYISLLTGSYSGAGNISVMVGNKQQLRSDLMLSMTSVKNLIKAYYPTDYQNRWRTFGFQKERF